MVWEEDVIALPSRKVHGNQDPHEFAEELLKCTVGDGVLCKADSLLC